jgi:putative hemolysin
MDSNLSYWIVLIVCLFLSAMFSGAEMALTTVPETYIRKLIDERRGFIQPFKLWLLRPNRVLTAIIVGNNLVNTLAAVVATVFAQKLFDHYVISIATGTVTIALLIFGEITPKTFARHNARKVIYWAVYIIYPIYFILFPAVWVLTHFAVFLIQLMGGHTKREGPVATEEDIAHLIKLSHEEGVFKPDQGMMLQSVIAFRDTAAREIMVPRTNLFSLPIDASFEEVVSQVTQHGFTRWPVYTDDIDHVLGIFYVKDLINFQMSGGQNFVLKQHLRKAIFIPESMKLDAVLREFQRKKVHLAIVVDEYGGTAGVVTLEDILEEIVGEIRDEYDKEEEQSIKRLGADHFVADGRASISDIQRSCSINIPTDDSYETLGGFLISVFGKIPRKNAEYLYHHWRFRVIEVEEKRIVKVEMTKADKDKPK